ncbi:hypothetical protein, conserved in Apicomplexan species [Plasmodium knowlesi strain H]|uniref:Uncharacterized protein n=3 Tax=Plasmodium knowlesi TaxID=5850 RepID=A0A5K1VDN0_PLAKH|nr:uncharacterized protein PKNH_1418200 [Plasmodium knowlesi strain H]OTN63907.1 Uncharacterized protein PKNOH_S140236000 [Plasmodium knowlesi]CAA9990782.1 conserved protein, unknown function [Plasmodium knowlesi strain H]SBO21086.1 hypothetical protein, conserved in Apicomplexan species [Plasmodium knowlesi strain H]SBO21565.1 hypothetical protein, conserved in Apicomplexan species [Plasmodium knowlesi strain H]VVS80256.1 conserved protein, unknown function [Plasmodium knowlesi strain H]|eukprot:XP_002262071.1 [Plasmodium knowlesi strain H]
MGFFYSGYHKPSGKNIRDRRAQIFYVLGLFVLPTIVTYAGSNYHVLNFFIDTFKPIEVPREVDFDIIRKIYHNKKPTSKSADYDENTNM